MQGIYGTTSKNFFIDAIQKELDKGVEKGIITMEEGLEFIKDRKNYYDNYLKEQSKTTDEPIALPSVEEYFPKMADGGRIGFAEGPPGLTKRQRTKAKYLESIPGYLDNETFAALRMEKFRYD